MDSELLKDVLHVDLRCGLTDEQRLGYLLVAPTLHDQFIDVLLSP